MTAGIVIMCMSAIVQCIFIFSWTPNPNEGYAIFLMALVFAISESVAKGQTRGLNMFEK